MRSIIFKPLVLMAGVLLLAAGCATVPRESIPPREQAPEPRKPVPEPEQAEKGPAPRTIASLNLTEQARLMIESNRPDEAIRLLERAMNIDPQNGRNYYFLAEAWLMKKNEKQASQFNRMAELYLDRDGAWSFKVREQKERIENSF